MYFLFLPVKVYPNPLLLCLSVFNLHPPHPSIFFCSSWIFHCRNQWSKELKLPGCASTRRLRPWLPPPTIFYLDILPLSSIPSALLFPSPLTPLIPPSISVTSCLPINIFASVEAKNNLHHHHYSSNGGRLWQNEHGHLKKA